MLRATLVVAVAGSLAAFESSAPQSPSRRQVSAPQFDRARAAVLYADSVLGPLRATQTVQVTVTASVTFDPGSGNYTYGYTLRNEPESQNAIESFALSPVPSPVSFGTPDHWTGGYGYAGNSHAFEWEVTDNDAGPLPPNDTGNVPLSPFNPGPGLTVTGFTVVTPTPPGTVSFYVQGFDTIPGGGETLGDEDPQPTIFQEGVHGTISGPLLQTVAVPEKPRGPRIEFRPPLPNPAGGVVSISFFLPSTAKIMLAVYDVSGCRVRILADGLREAGLHAVTWNGLDDGGHSVHAGVYFYKLLIDGRPAGERRVVILK